MNTREPENAEVRRATRQPNLSFGAPWNRPAERSSHSRLSMRLSHSHNSRSSLDSSQ